MKNKLIGIKDTAALLGWSQSKVRAKCIAKRHPDSRLRPVQKNRPWLWDLEKIWNYAEEEAHEKWAMQMATYEDIVEFLENVESEEQ